MDQRLVVLDGSKRLGPAGIKSWGINHLRLCNFSSPWREVDMQNDDSERGFATAPASFMKVHLKSSSTKCTCSPRLEGML